MGEKGKDRRDDEGSKWNREAHPNSSLWLPHLPTFLVCTVYDMQAAQGSSLSFPFPAMTGNGALLAIVGENSLKNLHFFHCQNGFHFL